LQAHHRNQPDIELAEPYYLPRIQAVPNDPYAPQQQALAAVKAYEAFDIYQGDPSVVIGISDDGCNSCIPISGMQLPSMREKSRQRARRRPQRLYRRLQRVQLCRIGRRLRVWQHILCVEPSRHTSGRLGSSDHQQFIGVAAPAYNCKFFPIRGASDPTGIDIYVNYGYPSIIYAQYAVSRCLTAAGATKKHFRQSSNPSSTMPWHDDVAIVAAAGNGSNRYYEYYPAAYKGVLGVGETGTDGKISDGTSLGEHVKIFAPGSSNWTTNNNDTYSTAGGGTSFAEPLVAGALGLVRSRYPQLNATQSIEFLRQMTDDISGENPQITPRVLPGMLNMLKAMQTDPMSIYGISPESIEFVNRQRQHTTVFGKRFNTAKNQCQEPPRQRLELKVHPDGSLQPDAAWKSGIRQPFSNPCRQMPQPT
jgi:hypothetical protein